MATNNMTLQTLGVVVVALMSFFVSGVSPNIPDMYSQSRLFLPLILSWCSPIRWLGEAMYLTEATAQAEYYNMEEALRHRGYSFLNLDLCLLLGLFWGVFYRLLVARCFHCLPPFLVSVTASIVGVTNGVAGARLGQSAKCAASTTG